MKKKTNNFIANFSGYVRIIILEKLSIWKVELVKSTLVKFDLIFLYINPP